MMSHCEVTMSETCQHPLFQLLQSKQHSPRIESTMISFWNFLAKRNALRGENRIQNALALHRAGEARPDGLTLIRASHHLEIEWRAREIHPWDRNSESMERELLFIDQAIADTDAALSRLFRELTEVDVIKLSVIHPHSQERMLEGSVERSARVPSGRGLSPRTRLWHRGVTITILAIVALAVVSGANRAHAQTTTASAESSDSSTSTDLFVMIGSDFDRPGLLPRSNYNIGIGHTFGFLKKDPIGDELTFGYTYENAGTHGFLHTQFGEHTESLGVMKNFSLPKTKTVTGYTWLQSGITSYTGKAHVQNRLDSGVSIGAIVHFNNNNSVWIQESYSKVVTVPWYTTFSIGYTYSW
jgi:hypothetical protein